MKIKGSLLISIPIISSFGGNIWLGHVTCIYEVADDHGVVVGIGRWNPRPQFAYSLYNIHGATMKMKGSLLMSVSVLLPVILTLISTLLTIFLKMIRDGCLVRCDELFPAHNVATYVNESLKHSSHIDYVLVSNALDVAEFCVVYPDINFSDHLPLMTKINTSAIPGSTGPNSKSDSGEVQWQLRWDKADRVSYYYYTGECLSPLIAVVNNIPQAFDPNDKLDERICDCIEFIYSSIVSVLNSAADSFVPKVKRGFFKFWWNEELNLLKEASVDSHRLWVQAGKPRDGPLFRKRQTCRMQYRKCLRDSQNTETVSYTNDLHDALLEKNGKAFWQCWRSKFESTNKCIQVNGKVDAHTVSDDFASYFRKIYSFNNQQRAEQLKHEYQSVRDVYHGMPISDAHVIDTELVENVVATLNRGKAAGIDGLSAEHLIFSHPSLRVILAKLFQMILSYSYIPHGFRYSYIVPLPKTRDHLSKALSCDDFRGIAISPILSKVFEYCILSKFKNFLSTADNQFGFKQGIGCNFAIRSLRGIVDKFVKGGSTVNLCALDLSKAFDKVNHHALYLKLMKRLIPEQFLSLLENWLSCCFSCVKWFSEWSAMFRISFGVRQGSVLAPFLFAVYLDDLAESCSTTRATFIILYADDILLISPSVCGLEKLLKICECELNFLDMSINFKKCSCIRIGPRCNSHCGSISSSTNVTIPWVNEFKYLGVTLINSHTFKCSLDQPKKSFYRAANAIFGKIGRSASEEVTLELIKSKCIPVLLYGLEACYLSKAQLSSLDFVVNRLFMKLFRTNNIEIVKCCQYYLGFNLPSVMLAKRTVNFEEKFKNNCTFGKYFL